MKGAGNVAKKKKFPGIAGARRIGKECGARGVLLVTVAEDGTYQIASWGRTKGVCGEMKIANEQLGNLIDEGYVELDLRECRKCGCTQHLGCEVSGARRCHWVADDLCSACAGDGGK